MKQRLPYEPALDGLRGVSVLAVMVFHALPITLPGGFLGVDIFFALSGYLITRLLLLEYEKKQRIDLLAFYLRRWFRLGPALMAMLFIYGLTVWLFSPDSALNNQGVDILLAFLYLTNWARALMLKEPGDLGHTWSLAVEEQFYIVWPLMLWLLLHTLGPKFLLLLAIIVLAVCSWGARQYLMGEGFGVDRIYNGLDTRAETLMWGAALAVWLDIRKNSTKARTTNVKTHVLVAISLVSMLTLLSSADWTSNWYYQFGITITSVFSLKIIEYLHTTKNSSVTKFFSNQFLVWLGTISYGLYLWHFPLYRLLLFFGIQDGWLLLTGFFMTVPIAALSYYTLEKPLLRYQSDKLI